MKKLLLLLCTLFVSVSAWAETDSYNAADTGSDIHSGTFASNVTLTRANSTFKDSYVAGVYNNYVRSGANGTITITPLNGVVISKIQFFINSAYKIAGAVATGYQQSGTFTVLSGGGSVSLIEPMWVDAEPYGYWEPADPIVEWTGSSSSAVQIKHTKPFGWLEVRITYDLPTSADVTVSAAGYTSFYDSMHAIELPTGVEGWVAYMDGSFNFEKEYEAGDVVPAGTGIVLKAEEGNYTLNYSSEAGVAPANNDLMGSDAEATTVGPDSDEYLFYALSTGSHGVGFYWLAEDGAAFTSAAYKAYLPVKKSAAARSGFGFDEATAISSIGSEEAATATFNLAGQRVENAKGLVIKNGKKMFVK